MSVYIGRRYVLETLRYDFGIVCKLGCLDEVRAFYMERIMAEPAFDFEPFMNQPTNIPEYSRFMGSVYCNLDREKLPDPVSRWLLCKAAEIHNLY